MSSRLDRKRREDIVYKGCGGITDALDDAIKQQWRIDDFELDWIVENATDEELDLFIGNLTTYSDKKLALLTVNKLIELSREDD